jgi:DNA-binding GntR family transcriptional regulator
VEAELTTRYGMSKTPIREAINLLRKEGLVQVLPRRGTLVKPVNVQDVQNTFMVRMLLEPEAAALASQRATGEQLAELQRLREATQERQNAADRHEANRLLHVAIAEASGVSQLVSMIESLHYEVERFYNAHPSPPPAIGEHRPGGHHTELVDAIVSGDAEQTRLIVIEGIRASRRRLIETLIEDPRPVISFPDRRFSADRSAQ